MNYLQRARAFKTKKRLGQNFLIDPNVINLIVDTANLQEDETVVEIGAGAGFVTENVAPLVKKMYAIELDSDAADILEGLPFDNLEVMLQDILKTDFSDFLDSKVKVVANIPYYITSPILAHLLGEIDEVENKNRSLISEVYLMVQYEVAQRICATPESPNKQYGLLSILANFWATPELICKVPAKAFWPAPKVDSAVIKLTINEKPKVEMQNPGLFKQVIKGAFSSRRKTLVNALSQKGFAKDKTLEALAKMDISENIRGEKLSIEKFEQLARLLDQE